MKYSQKRLDFEERVLTAAPSPYMLVTSTECEMETSARRVVHTELLNWLSQLQSCNQVSLIRRSVKKEKKPRGSGLMAVFMLRVRLVSVFLQRSDVRWRSMWFAIISVPQMFSQLLLRRPRGTPVALLFQKEKKLHCDSLINILRR